MTTAATDSPLWCVVPAAGSGSRFGGETPKQYLPLAGKPLLLQTLERLSAHPSIGGLMVVLATGDERWPRIESLNGKPVLTSIGGSERADSVLAGLLALPFSVHQDHFVLVHDAARPCVRANDIARLIARAASGIGGILACPVRDTIKFSDPYAKRNDVAEPGIDKTISRDGLWRALTPQMFRRGDLTHALQVARGRVSTDEASAMETAGHRPLLVEGSEDNIKVTTPADLALAEFILARQSCG